MVPDDEVIGGLTPAPTPEPATPIHLTISEEVGPRLPVPDIVEYYDAIGMGEVVERLPAQWTTPDGQRPADPWSTVPDEYTIVTPYVIELKLPDGLPPGVAARVLALSIEGSDTLRDAQSIVIVAQGGQVGADVVEYHGVAQSYEIGERVIVAINNNPTFDPEGERAALVPTPKGPGWWVSVKFTTEGDVATDYQGKVPLEQLVREIVQAIRDKPSAPALPEFE